ncbi:helix-turn-helix domain-containing protein [Nostoc sp. HG1]|nr:helix-turn-helix domain-containing protein [Nostoc sp. HG1]
MNKPTLPTNREQAERLAEMGLQLCELRQQQEISLEQVASQTRIQPRFLQAIEQGKLENLPESIYIQSFIRQYADAIGLDGVKFASAFPALYRLPDVRPSWRSLPGAQLRPVHLYLLYMLLIISAVNGLSYLLNRSVRQPELANAETNVQPVAPAAIGPINPLQAVAKSSLAPKLPGAQKAVRVGLMLTSQSWVRVVADGKTEFEGVLSEGTQRAWAANQKVVVRAGNAGGVMVSFNDGQSKKLGESGEIEEMAFPPDPRFATLPNAVHEMNASPLAPREASSPNQ